MSSEAARADAVSDTWGVPIHRPYGKAVGPPKGASRDDRQDVLRLPARGPPALAPSGGPKVLDDRVTRAVVQAQRIQDQLAVGASNGHGRTAETVHDLGPLGFNLLQRLRAGLCPPAAVHAQSAPARTAR